MVLEAFANSVPRTVPSNLALDVIKLRVNLQHWRPRWRHPKILKLGYTVYGTQEALQFQAFLGRWSIILHPAGHQTPYYCCYFLEHFLWPWRLVHVESPPYIPIQPNPSRLPVKRPGVNGGIDAWNASPPNILLTTTGAQRRLLECGFLLMIFRLWSGRYLGQVEKQLGQSVLVSRYHWTTCWTNTLSQDRLMHIFAKSMENPVGEPFERLPGMSSGLLQRWGRWLGHLQDFLFQCVLVAKFKSRTFHNKSF